jgi:lambda family phage tail tape measure protein
MAVEWVAKNTIMLAATKLLHLMDGTLTTTTETEKTAAVVTGSATRKVAAISEAEAWLASAAMSAAGSVASIPYVGWALAIAAMADVEGTGQGIIATAALAGFMSGGYSGDIPTNQIAGVVHGQEFIFDAAATSRIGPENLEAMRRGEYRPSSVQSSSGSGSADGGVDIKHVVVYDRQSFLNELKSSDARRVMVTHLNHPETKARLGIRT